ncbi:serine hydrolase domain-containing protein [Paenibacillus sp. MBLB4367]|uniref:serine hydrolase domain-containing protein n=1 Tax=Paenibacillus sp. MBLB4367 TaxID=3384767 RepID=UPI00390802CE
MAELMPGNRKGPVFDGERLSMAWKVIDTEIERGEIPGASVVASLSGKRVSYTAGVMQGKDSSRQHVDSDTIYDCASLTKVVVTLPLILMLIDEGLLHLGQPVAEILPAFADAGKEQVTIRQLLTHSSGLQAYASPASLGGDSEQTIASICRLQPAYEPGSRVVYSCLGYITLGKVIESVLGVSLHEAAAQRIFQPLGMASSGYVPAADRFPRIATTELDPAAGEYRHGVVHDELAAAMGGISGNAGLFAAAADIAAYGEMWVRGGNVNGRQLLSLAAVEAAARSHTAHLSDANRGLGWVLRGDAADACGDWLSGSAYGHTGFTGTSLCIDPERELVVALLTNRVHYGRDKSVSRLRIRLHNALAAAIAE